MILAPITIVLNVLTLGTAGTAVKGAQEAAKNLAKAKQLEQAADSLDKLGKLESLYNAAEAFRARIEQSMADAENDIASVTNEEIAAQIEKRHAKNSPMYKSIARVWTQVYLSQGNSDLAMALTGIIANTIDPTGIVGAVQAFKQVTISCCVAKLLI